MGACEKFTQCVRSERGPERAVQRGVRLGPLRVAILSAGSAIGLLALALLWAQGSQALNPAAAPSVEVQLQSYSLAAGGASAGLGVSPADILGVGRTTLIACGALGLVCTDGEGNPDDLADFSFGADFVAVFGLPAYQFSVAQGSQGASGSAANAEAACTPAQPQADAFQTALDRTNSQDLDGDGAACAANGGFGLGLVEEQPGDDLDGLGPDPCQFVDLDCNGQIEAPVYFSLAPDSPSLAAFGATAADILIATGSAPPTIWANGEADLGLAQGDALDALCLLDNGDGVYGEADVLIFSLAPGSPSLTALGASAADLLRAHELRVVARAASLGLAAGDDLDALNCTGAIPNLDGEIELFLPSLNKQ